MLNGKIKGSRSFFHDILRNLILLLVVPMVTILLIFWHADQTVKEQVQESASQNLNLYYEQIEDIMKDMRTTCLSILEDADCKMYALEWLSDSKHEIKLKQNIYKFLENLIDTRYHDIFIYYERDGRCISGKYTSLPAERYYEAYYGENSKDGYKEEFLQMLQTANNQITGNVIKDHKGKEYLCMTINTGRNKNAVNSYTICVVLSTGYLNETMIMRDIDKERIFLTYNGQNQLVLNNNSKFKDMEAAREFIESDTENSVWLDKDKYMIQIRDSEIVKNKYLYLVPYESFWNELQQLRIYCFLGIIFCVVISIYMAYRGAKRTYNPIENIVEFIRKKEEGITVEARKQPEFAYIMSYINSNESKIKEYKKGMKEWNLYNLLEGRSSEVNAAMLAKDNISFPHSKYAVCLMMIEMAKDDISDIHHFVIKNVLEELGNAIGKAYVAEFSRNRCALLLNLDAEREEIESLLKEGQTFVQQFCQMTLTIGVSSIHEEASQIPEAYKEAQEALRYRFLMGRGCQIYYEDISGRNLQGQRGGESKIYMLLLDYVKGEKDICDVESFVESLGYIYEVNEEVSVDMAHFFKREVVTALGKILGIFGYDEIMQKQIAKELAATDTLMEFKKQLSVHLSELRELHAEKKPREDICAKTRNYIDENYSDTQLSVSMLGEAMGMQAAHLSKIFKEAYGISISDYIAKVRIKHAKQMIKEQNMSVQETAEKTGFISSHAFIRIFKKLENMTPGKYKELCEK